MGEITMLRDLAVVIVAAGMSALVFERVRQSKTLGYILAGVVMGPRALSLVQSSDTVQTLADLGIMFLMFSLGLEFNLRKLRRVGGKAVVTAVLDVIVMVWIGYQLGQAFGLGAMESVFLGAIVCDSSTAILTRTLKDMGQMREPFAQIIFGATIVEDVLAIALIAMLTGGAFTGDVHAAGAVFRLVKLAVFLVVLVIIGVLLVPRLLVYAAKSRSDELLVIAVLALCFGASLLSVQLRFSLALGAFVIGAVAAESRLIGRVELLVAPFRHLFGAAFFIAVGLMVEPYLMLRHAAPILGIAATVMVGKSVNCFLGAFLTGSEARTAFRVGMGMAQVCEFAFIIAALGMSLHVIGPFVYQMAIGAAVVTVLVNPLLLEHADRLADALARRVPYAVRANLLLYTEAVRRVGLPYRDNAVRKTVRRSLWVIIVNMAFVAAIFIGAGYVATAHPFRLPAFLDRFGAERGVLWAMAVVCALPFYAASARKVHALGMIAAEVAVPASNRAPSAGGVRTLIAALMLFLGIVGMAVLTFLLSSTLLPSWHVVVGVLLLVALATTVGWRSLIKLYARVQSAVRETFATELPPPKPEGVPAIIGALMDKDLEAVAIETGSPVIGQSIQELHIRTQTGATVVSIERQGDLLLNPEVTVTLKLGDRVLLLGSPEQTEAARRLFTSA